MKYDTMQIERMKSGGHRIEVRNEKESDVFYADGGPEALDIVRRVLAGVQVLQGAKIHQVIEVPTPPAPEEDCLAEVSGYRAEWERLAARIDKMEEVHPSWRDPIKRDIEKMHRRIASLERSDEVSGNSIVENGGRIDKMDRYAGLTEQRLTWLEDWAQKLSFGHEEEENERG